MAWKQHGRSFLPFAEVLTEYNAVVAPITDVSDNYHEARRRLAERLEATARDLRK